MTGEFEKFFESYYQLRLVLEKKVEETSDWFLKEVLTIIKRYDQKLEECRRAFPTSAFNFYEEVLKWHREYLGDPKLK